MTAAPSHFNPAAKDALRADRGALEAAIVAAGGAVIRGNVVRCPFHDDRHPSGSIHRAEGGAWRFRCHVCDITEDVIGVRALSAGGTSADQLRAMRREDRPAQPPRVFPDAAALLDSVGRYATVEDHYPYTDPVTGRVDLLVIRCRDGNGRKSFLQARPEPGGGFVMRAPPKPWPLFNRARVAAAETVVVCEGEKCVKALHAAGVVATTSPGGAENARNADWAPLTGKAEVTLWPDRDEAGAAYMRDVADVLAKLNPPPGRVRWIDPAGLNLPEKGDAADFLALFAAEGAEAQREAVQTVIAGADDCGPAERVRRILLDTISGKRVAVAWPWPTLGSMTQALLPGTITVVCGEGGSTKTYFVLQAAAHWLAAGIPFALRELEEDEDGATLTRVLGQRSPSVHVSDAAWVRENPDDALEAYERHRPFLEQFGRSLWAIPGDVPKLDELADWCRDRAKEGRRVLVIDPVTGAEQSDKPWLDDKRFVRNVQSILRERGASLVAVTHPSKGRKAGAGGLSMDDLAGGAAWQRFTQTVLWLRRFDEPRAVRVGRVMAGHPVTGNIEIHRSLKIFKARNGKGTGKEIAFTFGEGMLFAEQGVILKQREGET